MYFIVYLSTIGALSAIILSLIGDRGREFLWSWVVNSAVLFLFTFIAIAVGHMYFGGENFLDARVTALDTLFASQDATVWTILVFCGLGFVVTLKNPKKRSRRR